MTDEKRRQRRFNTRKRLWCEGQDHALLGEARNISQGGMFIVAEEETEIGQQIKVTFKDENQEVALNLEVMWKAEAATGQSGMGVRIIGFDRGEEAYQQFLEKHELAPTDEFPVISELSMDELDEQLDPSNRITLKPPAADEG